MKYVITKACYILATTAFMPAHAIAAPDQDMRANMDTEKAVQQSSSIEITSKTTLEKETSAPPKTRLPYLKQVDACLCT